MIANPKPIDRITPDASKHAVIETDARGPHIRLYRLKTKRPMTGVVFPEPIILSSELFYFTRHEAPMAEKRFRQIRLHGISATRRASIAASASATSESRRPADASRSISLSQASAARARNQRMSFRTSFAGSRSIACCTSLSLSMTEILTPFDTEGNAFHKI